MIDWGDTPIGSKASIYWPQVASADVLALAKTLYSTHQLSAADANTIQCTVPDGFTFVPIPSGAGENFTGLFTVDLPQGVTAGQEFTITVRRLSTSTASAPPPPPNPPPVPKIAQHVEKEREQPMLNWRYVVGTFAVRIPVTTAETMLPLEGNTLAIIKWRLSQMVPSNRWVPVLKRYIGLIEGRIQGLGGNPGTIDPSPWGAKGGPPIIIEKPHEDTGKVVGIVYDRLGDFEGFRLLTEKGEERTFNSRESKIEELVRFAWRDRVVIEVRTILSHPHIPTSIILLRMPRWEL